MKLTIIRLVIWPVRIVRGISFCSVLIIFVVIFAKSQVYFVEGCKDLLPLLLSHGHLFVCQQAIVQGLLDRLVFEPHPDEHQLLPAIAMGVLLTRTVVFAQVSLDQFFLWCTFPKFAHFAHPRSLSLYPEDISSLLEATHDKVGSRQPYEALGSQHFAH